MATDIPFSLLFKGRNGSTEKSFRFTLGAHALGAVSRLCGGGEGEGEEKREDESRTGGNPIERHDDNETIFDGFDAHKPNNSIAGAEAVGREKIATANIVYVSGNRSISRMKHRAEFAAEFVSIAVS